MFQMLTSNLLVMMLPEVESLRGLINQRMLLRCHFTPEPHVHVSSADFITGSIFSPGDGSLRKQ